MSRRFDFLVHRLDGYRLDVAAHIIADCDIENGPDSENGLLDALNIAIKTAIESGDDDVRRVYEYAGNDMNIGDLISHGIIDNLRHLLSQLGVERFEADIVDQSNDWVYDSSVCPEICTECWKAECSC